MHDPAADHSLEALSERAGFSVRRLTRVFQHALGVTPGRCIEGVRVEAAKARLQRSDEPLATIARATGFGSKEMMRRAFWRELSTTPAAYREGSPPPAPQPTAKHTERMKPRRSAPAWDDQQERRSRLLLPVEPGDLGRAARLAGHCCLGTRSSGADTTSEPAP